VQRKLDGWRALPGNERWLLVGLTVLLPLIDVALHLLGVRRTCRLLGGSGGTASGRAAVGEDQQAVARRLGRLVNIASRHGPWTATCLRRSLALRWLLRRRGLPAELCVGVGRDDGRMHAHAWVELSGRVVDDQPTVVAEYAPYRELESRIPRPLRAS